LLRCCCCCCCCCGGGGGDCGGFTVVRMMGWVEVEWLVYRWRQIVCVHACKQFDCFLLVTCELGNNKPATTMKFVHSRTGWNEYKFQQQNIKSPMGPRPSLHIPETVLKQKNDMSGESNYTKRYYDRDVNSELRWHCMPKSFNSDFGKHESSSFFPYGIYMKHSFAFCHAHVQFNSSIR
jgi:hypothetical protein